MRVISFILFCINWTLSYFMWSVDLRSTGCTVGNARLLFFILCPEVTNVPIKTMRDTQCAGRQSEGSRRDCSAGAHLVVQSSTVRGVLSWRDERESATPLLPLSLHITAVGRRQAAVRPIKRSPICRGLYGHYLPCDWPNEHHPLVMSASECKTTSTSVTQPFQLAGRGGDGHRWQCRKYAGSNNRHPRSPWHTCACGQEMDSPPEGEKAGLVIKQRCVDTLRAGKVCFLWWDNMSVLHKDALRVKHFISQPDMVTYDQYYEHTVMDNHA